MDRPKPKRVTEGRECSNGEHHANHAPRAIGQGAASSDQRQGAQARFRAVRIRGSWQGRASASACVVEESRFRWPEQEVIELRCGQQQDKLARRVEIALLEIASEHKQARMCKKPAVYAALCWAMCDVWETRGGSEPELHRSLQHDARFTSLRLNLPCND